LASLIAFAAASFPKHQYNLIRLFEKGVLSSGQAAKLVGISKRQFLENVGRYGVSIFGETTDDIEKYSHIQTVQ